MPPSRERLSTVPQPWVMGMKFVSQEAGLIATMLAATRPSSALTRLYISLPRACSIFRSARLFLLARRLVYSSSSTTKLLRAKRPSS